MASPAPTSRATLRFRVTLFSSCFVRMFRPNCPPAAWLRLGRYPHRLLADHPVDGALVVTEFTRDLTNSRRRPSDHRPVGFEARRRLGLPNPSDHRLIELRDDVARDYLLVMNDLAAAQNRRARNVGGIEPLEPFGGGGLADILRHPVDAGGSVERARRGGWKA